MIPFLVSQFLGPPPALVQISQHYLATELGIPATALIWRSGKPQTWPDGCLGLPKPEEICSQALVEGWELQFQDKNQGKVWQVRTDREGEIKRVQRKPL